jgi:hypothetical protein
LSALRAARGGAAHKKARDTRLSFITISLEGPLGKVIAKAGRRAFIRSASATGGLQ